MADLVITAANVASGANADTETGTAGVTIAAGDAVYKDASDGNKVKLADANASSATAALAGIALHASLSGQPVTFQRSGSITIGAPVTAGLIYVLSATAGKIAPSADLAAGWRTSLVGVATSTTVIRLVPYNSDTAIA